MIALDYALRFFKNKRILIFVPHQDDEICVAGCILHKLVEVADEVRVVYLTDGNYEFPARVRKREAIRALKVYGVTPDKIYFMGYPDTPEEALKYTYFDEIDGKSQKQIEAEFKTIVDVFKPEIIIGNDLDAHPNHKAVSLILDGYFQQHKKYSTLDSLVLLKTFAYDTSFYGPSDYTCYNLQSSQSSHSELLDNPELKWEERLRLPVAEEARTQRIDRNIVLKAMRKHVSQYGVRYAARIANSDQIYWMRCETDNQQKLWFAKLCINNKFVYDYYGNENPTFHVVAYYTSGKRIDEKELHIKYIEEKVENYMRVTVEVSYRKDIVYDTIRIFPLDTAMENKIIKKNSRIMLWYQIVDRVKYKLTKIFNGVK